MAGQAGLRRGLHARGLRRAAGDGPQARPDRQPARHAAGGRAEPRGSSSQVSDKDLDRAAAIVSSMTAEERRNPKIINGSRRARIASGSGVTVGEVNQLIVRFLEGQKMMRQMMGSMPGMGVRRQSKTRGKAKKKGKGGGRPAGANRRPQASAGRPWRSSRAWMQPAWPGAGAAARPARRRCPASARCLAWRRRLLRAAGPARRFGPGQPSLPPGFRGRPGRRAASADARFAARPDDGAA